MMSITVNLRQRLGPRKRAVQTMLSNKVPQFIGAANFFHLNGAFREEQAAVAAGKKKHLEGELDHSNRMFLRRSVHRIEKGLISQPRRDTFAADYIGRTVETAVSLQEILKQDDPGELKWATDVLNRYFEATQNSTDQRIGAARERWLSVRVKDSDNGVCDISGSACELAPFEQPQLSDAADRYQSLTAIAYHRRSVRWFEDKPVERELVEEAAAVGLTAPSACNRQSFRLLVVDDEDLRKRVAEVPMGTAGFSHQIPAMAVLIGQHRGYEHERDRHAIYVDGGLFTTGFILALEGLGLNTCCINWPELKSKNERIRDLIDLDSDERVIMMIAIGYGVPDQLVPRSHKRSVSAVVQWA